MTVRRRHLAARHRRLLAVAALTAASTWPAVAPTPADADVPARVSGADQDRDGVSDLAELGATALARPSLAPLTTALARRHSEPVRLLFLGSSTTYGVGASSPAAGFVGRFVTRLQMGFPVATSASRSPRSLDDSTRHPDDGPGVQGINGAVGGSTAATYYTAAHDYALRVVRPTCVVHMIGSNDSVAKVPTATFMAQVESVIRRIDAASERPPCHLLLQPVRRYQVSLQEWQEYRDALAQLASRRPRVTFIDLGGTFEAYDALGADPADLVGPDSVHLTDAGHALLARTLVRSLALSRHGLGTGTDPRRPDTDRDGLEDGRELRGIVVRQRVAGCSQRVRLRLRVRPLPYLRDSDGDGIADRREVDGYRLPDGRLVRTDPTEKDTDGDGRPDGREAMRRHGDPTTCD